MDIINTRRSVRQFSEKKVEKAKIDLLLKAAMQAPSARNQQPWHFIVVENKEKLFKLAGVSSGYNALLKAPLAVVFLSDKENLLTPSMYPQDMSAAMENMLLEARSLGLGTCWLGTYPNEDRMEKVVKLFSLPNRFEPFAICAVGYPQNNEAFKYVDRYQASRVHYEEV